MAENLATSAGSDAADPPGYDGIWIFVFIDMLIFMMMFVTYISERIRLPELFAASQHALTPIYGLVNTVVLLISSWAMVTAVNAARRSDIAKTRIYIALCFGFGLLFCAIKITEYSVKIGDGITPATNSFFTFYYVITGMHFLHVVGGLVFVLHCLMRVGTEGGGPAYVRKLESAGLFWHFVDLLWLFIFPLIFLGGLQ